MCKQTIDKLEEIERLWHWREGDYGIGEREIELIDR